ncbi:MAG: LptF/LptG family permease [Synergistetes bacterium]|nr:LptF/LptG family permease [Synergistota bacterium]MDW8193115.1 LptF/LptG family permease [Synergistota bacterium]
MDRYIVQSLLPPFLFGVGVFTVLLVAGDVLFYLANLVVNQGLSIWVAIKLFLYKLPEVVVMTFPMSMLLATLLAFGKMSSHGEMIALRSIGVSFGRILIPVIVMAVLVALFSFTFNETVVPLTRKAVANLLEREFGRRAPSLKEDVFFRDMESGELRRVIYVSRMDAKAGYLRGVIIQEFESRRLRRIITAEEGLIDDGSWVLNDGRIYNLDRDGKVTTVGNFKRQVMALSFSRSRVDSTAKEPQEMTLKELKGNIELLKAQGVPSRRLEVRYNQRFAIPWASVVFVLVGAPLALTHHRTSSSVGVGLSVLIIFVYYVLLSLGQAFGDAGEVPPSLAAWLPNLILGGVGTVLCLRAPT